MSRTAVAARMIRLRTDEHRQLIHELRTQAEKWLRDRGLDQFQPDGPSQAWRAHEIINEVFDRGEFVGLELEDGRLVAVGATKEADPDFWTAEERAEPQVYVARFLVAEHGHGYGEQLLARIADQAAARGTPVMRLDCWRTSTGLQDYYRRLGFRHLRTVVVEDRGSGALFELDLRKPSPLMNLSRQLT